MTHLLHSWLNCLTNENGTCSDITTVAPEIIELNPATPKSDIWSVGCTVIELLTGDPPYYDLAPMPALYRIVQDQCPPIPECSKNCRGFLMECFQKDPFLRWTADKLLNHPFVRPKDEKKEAAVKKSEKVKPTLKPKLTTDGSGPASSLKKTLNGASSRCCLILHFISVVLIHVMIH